MNITSGIGDYNLDQYLTFGSSVNSSAPNTLQSDKFDKVSKTMQVETPKASPSSVIDDRTIKFLKDEGTGRTVVKFKRGDDIVHIPSEVAIKTDERIRNYLDRIMKDVLFIDLENLSTDDKIGSSVDISV
jgi:hypothetical protein